jgi:hypothetical protein
MISSYMWLYWQNAINLIKPITRVWLQCWFCTDKKLIKPLKLVGVYDYKVSRIIKGQNDCKIATDLQAFKDKKFYFECWNS